MPPPRSMASHLLYVEDDARLRNATARVLRDRYVYLQPAGSLAEAHALARPGTHWCGFIVDQNLPDGLGLDLIVELRALHPGVPAVLATGDPHDELVNACAAADVRYVLKPFGLAHLGPFFADVERFVTSPHGAHFIDFARDLRATDRELAILRLVLLERRSNAEIAAALGLSVHTVRTHIRNMLGKADARSMAELRQRLVGER
ncbi:MAG: response regulator transcription factor [Sandaracinaceae bacterium]|nr:response regulator transcription factor [Sandaracinaceae bacterium]